jgi:predicted TIM-barrel fold metal-dependent hydrolase
MICDVHVHVVGADSALPGRSSWLLRFVAQRAGIRLRDLALPEARRSLQKTILELLDESCVDHAVFLALDAPHDRDGKPIAAAGCLSVSNDDAAALAAAGAKAHFGASVHPYRKNALAELERAIRNGACLVKWLPAAQNICPDDPACFQFYEALAHHNIPLLSHTGNEHTFCSFDNSFNHPCRLEVALRMGVTVIAAHCGARLYLHERCYFADWASLAARHENLYGDLSAFCVPTRAIHLRQILRSPALLAKVLYGSDFPATALPLGHVIQLGLVKARELGRIRNPFDRPVAMLRSLGVPDEVFSRAASVVQLEVVFA